MIVVDTSAIVAIAFGEPERQAFVEVIRQADRALISTVSVVESRMVVFGRRGPRAVTFLDDLLRQPPFEFVAPDMSEMDAAYSAFVAFGRGSGHPAQLNFGDVFSYALAKIRGVPLLYKGDDFAQTDIRSAVTI
ncbi:type II toxin-antitoxin system VapC family toxin [Inquilinus sp. Marseille-Q2685]|uniref:type II toxin-antitoxin system VapC family toxin n=1 Tax=Inquilinus sp. Marseille-Q2685 TaxID=2866581 RepID=UPI001CE48A27|nr:type II toxin-antitoxin system VapC family toxin [Inquilinus sp. Marseille-Q2685]